MSIEQDELRAKAIKERVLNVESAWNRRRDNEMVKKEKFGYAEGKESFRRTEKVVSTVIKKNNPKPHAKAKYNLGFTLTRR